MQKTIYKFHNSNIEFHHLLLFNSQYRYCPTRRKNFKSKTYIKAKNSQMVHLINKTKMFFFIFAVLFVFYIFKFTSEMLILSALSQSLSMILLNCFPFHYHWT